MVEALVLEKFVTALACLCASSYGPNIKTEIETSVKSWDRDALEIFINSNTKFSFYEKFGDCELKNLSKEKLIQLDEDYINILKQQVEYGLKQCVKDSESLKIQQEKDQFELKRERNENGNLRKQLFDLKIQNDNLMKELQKVIIDKEQEIIKLKNQHIKDENKLNDVKTKHDNEKINWDKQIMELNKTIAKMKNMSPPILQSLKINCLMAAENGVANLELNVKEDFYCTKDLDAKFGTGWILIAQRFDGSVDFNRTWTDYVQGFGAYGHQNEFFAGLERIYVLVQNSTQELLIIFNDIKNISHYALYNQFSIENEKQNFMLKSLGEYTGNAGDALSEHLNQKFATFDKDNEMNCARKYGAGWWYIANNCFKRSPFGLYRSIADNDGGSISMRMFLRPINTRRLRIIIS